MVDLKRYENVFWGLGIIAVAVGTYVVSMFDGIASTVPDVNVLFTAIVIGIAKMRSASVGEMKQVKEVVSENREAMKQNIAETMSLSSAVADVQSENAVMRRPNVNPLL